MTTQVTLPIPYLLHLNPPLHDDRRKHNHICSWRHQKNRPSAVTVGCATRSVQPLGAHAFPGWTSSLPSSGLPDVPLANTAHSIPRKVSNALRTFSRLSRNVSKSVQECPKMSNELWVVPFGDSAGAFTAGQFLRNQVFPYEVSTSSCSKIAAVP